MPADAAKLVEAKFGSRWPGAPVREPHETLEDLQVQAPRPSSTKAVQYAVGA